MGINRTLSKKLDLCFSMYVRLSRINRSGYGNCVTCGHLKPFAELDCGHFMSRDHYPTRWDLKNVGIQCQGCNRFRAGRQFEFGQFIDKTEGRGSSAKLHFLAKTGRAPDNFQIQTMIEFYTGEVKKLRGRKII